MYSVVSGDTFESISRKVYGTESDANLIKKANPNVEEPLSLGISILIPVNVDKPTNRDTEVSSNNIDEVSLLIDNLRFRFFIDIIINKSMDNIDSISFNAPMESDNINFKNTFKPFSFKNLKVFLGKDKLFDGTMVSIDPSVTKDSKTVSVGGYARCGVLNDCTASSNQYPIEYNNTKLSQIANDLLKPFGLTSIFNSDEGAVFERVALKPSQNILNFLIKLANKRNLIITSDKDGNLLFQQSISSGDVIAVFEQGTSPLVSIKPIFSPQDYYSHITGIEPVMAGLSGSKFTIKNDLLREGIRPFVYEESDTLSSDMKTAVTAKMGRMFGNMVQYELEISSWRDKNDILFSPNTYIKVKAPDAMIYDFYMFLIKDVSFKKTPEKKSVILQIVLPQSFLGTIPKVLPWEG